MDYPIFRIIQIFLELNVIHVDLLHLTINRVFFDGLLDPFIFFPSRLGESGPGYDFNQLSPIILTFEIFQKRLIWGPD